MTLQAAARPLDQRRRIRIAQIAAAVAAGLILVSRPALAAPATQEIFAFAGLSLILLCVFGRLWSALYIGGVKNLQLVRTGPYSLTRNPLYVSSTLGAFGIGLTTGSLIWALIFGGFAWLLLQATARKEADFLRARFPLEYPAYERRVPLFWPKASTYEEGESLAFSPPALRRTFADASLFLAAVPLLKILGRLQEAGFLPVLFHLW